MLAIGFLTASPGISWADYPDRPITLIVIYSPGGGADLTSRALAKSVEKMLGQPIIVVNKPGAGGIVGASAIAAAKPDGYTIGTTLWAPLTWAPHMQDLPYDPFKSFDFIMIHGKYMYGPCVKSDSPFKTLKDLVDYAKANPSKIKYSTVGTSTPNNFGMILLGKPDGIKWENVIFKGGPEAVAACLGGHVDVVSQNPGDVVSYIKAGRLRLLASMSDTRWKWVSEVPTVRELGYNFQVTAYLGLGAPQGVPKPIMDKLREAFKKAANDSEFLQILDNVYVVPEYRTGDEYRKMAEEASKENEKMFLELGLHKSQKK